MSAAILAATSIAASAGPPYLTDDPEPTDTGHYEVYFFGSGTADRDGMDGEAGIDFNYGGAEDLQLTAVLPLAYQPHTQSGIGNIEFAAKYRFLHQEDFGLDVAVFPAFALPSASGQIGTQHVAVFLPVWGQKDWGDLSLFGGGGCTLNQEGDDRNFCQMGLAVTQKISDGLELGMEIFHQAADSLDSRASTTLGFGLTYDVNDSIHLLTHGGPELQNQDIVGRYNWYCALLATF